MCAHKHPTLKGRRKREEGRGKKEEGRRKKSIKALRAHQKKSEGIGNTQPAF
ncbi:MAG: hypothetical protein ABI180_19680 [Microcoleus sp.]